jgi:hypothetical protein
MARWCCGKARAAAWHWATWLMSLAVAAIRTRERGLKGVD